MSRAIILLLAISWLAAGSLGSDQLAKLKSDKRLAVEVDLSIAGKPLPVLCEQLSEATGVKIWADVQVAAEKVAVFCKERPAWEVMAHVADLFGYTWGVEKREGEEPKYKLFQDSASMAKDHEAKMAYLKQGWDTSWKAISERAELWNRYKDDQDAIAIVENVRDDLIDETRGYQDLTEQEKEVRRALCSPRRAVLATFIASLPEPTLDLLLDGQRTVFSTYFTDARWRLDPALADEIGRAPVFRFNEFGEPEPPPQGRFIGAVLSLRFGPGEAGDGDVRDIGLYAEFCARYEGGIVTEPYSGHFGSLLGYDYKRPRPGESSEEREALLEEFPWLGVRTTVELSEEEKRAERRPRIWVPEMLRRLHEATGRSIVSDAYWSRGKGTMSGTRNTPLLDYVNRLCYRDILHDAAYTWEPAEEWLHFRSHLYPIARMEEVPAELVEALRAKSDSEEGLGLPELAQVASLSDWQRNALGMGGRAPGLERIPYAVREHLDSLRICGKVKPSLISGDNFDFSLQYTKMTGDQQRIFLDHLAGPKLALWPNPAELPHCVFGISLKTAHELRNELRDWPRGMWEDFQSFRWSGTDPKAGEAAYDEFIKENPRLLKTKLYHYVTKTATFTYKAGDEVIETSTLQISRKEVKQEEKEAERQDGSLNDTEFKSNDNE